MLDAPKAAPREIEPHISIIIPVYNRSTILPRALESIARQNVTGYEVIIVDDGSTDDSATAARAFPGISSRVVRHETCRGPAAARNSGIRAARGNYIAFLDSDDEWAPNKLAMQLNFLTGSSGGRHICCSGYVLLKEGQPPTTINVDQADTQPNVLWGCTLSPGTTLIADRECFDRVGLFDENLKRLEDWDWILRARRHYRIHVVPEPLARVHTSPGTADPVNVAQALQRINERRAMYGLTWSRPLELLQFRSTILLERAAIYHRAGDTRRALWNGMLSVLAYPLRNAAFFKKMGKLLWRTFTSRASS